MGVNDDGNIDIFCTKFDLNVDTYWHEINSKFQNKWELWMVLVGVSERRGGAGGGYTYFYLFSLFLTIKNRF